MRRKQPREEVVFYILSVSSLISALPPVSVPEGGVAAGSYAWRDLSSGSNSARAIMVLF
ncbi:MAG: hypothetical protein AAB691_02640 [Patescibacteria group bacterium]